MKFTDKHYYNNHSLTLMPETIYNEESKSVIILLHNKSHKFSGHLFVLKPQPSLTDNLRYTGH